MSAPLVVGVVCARPGCGHGEDLHDGICFGTACECVRFVAAAGALPMPVVPEPLALPWAHSMSDHDLHGFLDDLVSAAMGRWRSEPEVPDRTVLADIEKVCADWRTPGAGSRLDGSEFDGVTVRLAEPEPEFHKALHHDYRPGLGHDLPETGAASDSAACKACGSLPDQWCPDCGCCQKGCYDGHVDNPCGHENASWGAS